MSKGKKSKARKLSVVIVDIDTGRIWSRYVSVKNFRILLGIVIFLVCLLLLFGIYGILISPDYWKLKRENRSLKSQVTKVYELEKELSSLRKFRVQILRLLDIPVDTSSEVSFVSARETTKMSNPIFDLKDTIPEGYPVKGPIDRRFSKYHAAIDIVAPEGTPVRSTASGIVSKVYWDDKLGNVVVINHGKTYKTVYAHLLKAEVIPGIAIKKGQVIGLLGNTGHSSGPHLHYQIIKNGVPIDPLPTLKKGEK